MTWAVLIHIQIETIGVLDRSSSLLFLWVVLIDYFVFKVSSLSLVLKNKAECQVCHSCNKDVSTTRFSQTFQLNSWFKMVSKIEGTCKAKVIGCSWNEIEGQITPEN